MNHLALHCANHILRVEGIDTCNKEAERLHKMMRLELAHHNVEVISKGLPLKKGVSEGTYTEEKENNGECSNA